MMGKLLLYPPLAIARVGASSTPCDSFNWGPNDLTPRGTGKTTISPANSLRVSDDGTVSSFLPETLTFKDERGWKPVCPFFELHCSLSESGKNITRPVTPLTLKKLGKSSHDLKWKIEVANLKAYHMTSVDDDRIVATVNLDGDVTERQPLLGISPPGSKQPLVPHGKHLPLGSIQLTKPSEDSIFRLRFTPASGFVYGPSDLEKRTSYRLPTDRLIINPDAAWSKFRLVDGVDGRTDSVPIYRTVDYRTSPPGQFVRQDEDSGHLPLSGTSVGFIDDVCDGIISCSLDGSASAIARIVVGPPKYCIDRRPFISLADVITDRVKGDDVRDASYIENKELTALEIQDFLERVNETVGLINVDALNERSNQENESIARNRSLPGESGVDKAFPPVESVEDRPLPLTELARQRHRQILSLEVFEDMLREQPDFIEKYIRKPMTDNPYYDRKMPFGMLGSSSTPLHITRRQYDLLVAWQERLVEDAEIGT